MKVLATILFIASAALNVVFLTGCKSLHDVVFGVPCRFAPSKPQEPKQDDKAELARIAGLLDISTTGKTTSDLAADIYYKLDRSTDAPSLFDASSFEEMTKVLGPEQEKAMREYQQFISDMQGKRVIVIERAH